MHIAGSTLGAVALLAAADVANAVVCAPLGAVLPAPKKLCSNSIIEKAGKALIAKLESDIKNTYQSYNGSAMSIAVKSIYEDDLMFNWHYTPKQYSGYGTKKVDENTIYRVGSLSKVIPALLALQADQVDFESSVTKYIPELKNFQKNTRSVLSVDWSDITVKALASHLSGIADDSTYCSNN